MEVRPEFGSLEENLRQKGTWLEKYGEDSLLGEKSLVDIGKGGV